jgi:hypothetical protein
MDSKDRQKYIEEILKYCDPESIFIIDHYGHLRRLCCPFFVIAVKDVGEIKKDLICPVNAVKLDLNLIDVYIIRNKVLLLKFPGNRAKRHEPRKLLVESCCILFSAILRWFNSTIKSQEPLKTNRANSIHLG